MIARGQRGITLIEIMISVMILAILIVVGLPNFLVWIQNTQIRTAAEGTLNGLQSAKNEAIRRNAAVQAKFTGGSAWRLNLKSDPDGTPFLERAHGEGSQNAVLTITPVGADTVTFSGLGRIDVNADASAAITQIDIDNPTISAADSRQLRIVIPTGGAIRMCDPDPGVGATDPRRC